MATDSHGMGIPLPADSTKIHQFPGVTRLAMERVAEIMAGGITEGQQAAIDALAEDAVTAELAASDVITGDDPRAPELNTVPPVAGAEALVAAFLDANRRQTWLGARASDGGPSAWAMKLLTPRLGMDAPTGHPSLLFAVTDSQDRLTDFTLRATDGQVPDWVIDRWAARLQTKIITNAQLTAGDRYVRGAEVLPVMPDTTQVAGWGSSSMEGIGAKLATLFTGYGAAFYAGGKSGEQSTHIAARVGSVPALLTVAGGSIPDTGPVNVTASNMNASNSLKPFTGTLAGVPGTLSAAVDGSTNIFTRTTAGTAVAVAAGTPFIPDLGLQYRGAVTLLWMGKNDFDWNAGTEVATIARTDATFDWLAPLVRRVLVIGHFVNSDVAAGGEYRRQILATNAAHKARYGDLYVDVQDFLTGPEIWTYTGITPTQADLDQQALGNKPPSVSSDAGHMNAAGYTAVTTRIAERITALGWY